MLRDFWYVKTTGGRVPFCKWINDKFQTEHQFVGRICNRFSLAQQKKAWNILNGEDEIGYGTDKDGKKVRVSKKRESSECKKPWGGSEAVPD